MKVKMTLISDTILGNGNSVPGGEDIAILCDKNGFPFFRASTFKGIFREELKRYFEWTSGEKSASEQVEAWLGHSDEDGMVDATKITFTDFKLSDNVKKIVLEEIGNNSTEVTAAFTNLRTFTAIENGMAKEGSMRVARCINQGITFYSEIKCTEEQQDTVREVLQLIKWVGSMRNRGFGKVSIQER